MSKASKGKKRGHYYTKTYRHCECCGERHIMNTYDMNKWQYCTCCCEGYDHSRKKDKHMHHPQNK